MLCCRKYEEALLQNSRIGSIGPNRDLRKPENKPRWSITSVDLLNKKLQHELQNLLNQNPRQKKNGVSHYSVQRGYRASSVLTQAKDSQFKHRLKKKLCLGEENRDPGSCSKFWFEGRSPPA